MFLNTSFLGLRSCLTGYNGFRFSAAQAVPAATTTEEATKDSAITKPQPSKFLINPNTSHLAGLRGVAAIIVYNWHMLLPFYPELLQPYTDPTESSIFQLPLIRLLVTGNAAVSFYACIAGYMQSQRPLANHADVPTSKQFRLVGRKFLGRTLFILMTTVLATVPALVASYCGDLYQYADLGDVPFFLKDMFPIQQANLVAQLRDWLSFNSLFVTGIWTGIGWYAPRSHYGTHLWTVAPDLRASLYLIPFLSCCHLLASPVRTIIAAALTLILKEKFPDYAAGRICAMTYFGTTLACLTSTPIDQIGQTVLQIFHQLGTPLTILSMYIASLPIVSPDQVAGKNINPLMYTTSSTVANFLGVGLLSSIMIVAPPPSIRRFLTRKSVREFGLMSYSFYLIHQVMVHLIGYPAMKYLRDKHKVPVVPAVVVVGALLFPLVREAGQIIDKHVTQVLRLFVH